MDASQEEQAEQGNAIINAFIQRKVRGGSNNFEFDQVYFEFAELLPTIPRNNLDYMYLMALGAMTTPGAYPEITFLAGLAQALLVTRVPETGDLDFQRNYRKYWAERIQSKLDIDQQTKSDAFHVEMEASLLRKTRRALRRPTEELPRESIMDQLVFDYCDQIATRFENRFQ